MRRAIFSNVVYYSLLTAITGAIVWAMVGPEQAGLYNNPLAVAGLALIGLGLCKSERDRRMSGLLAVQPGVEDKPR